MEFFINRERLIDVLKQFESEELLVRILKDNIEIGGTEAHDHYPVCVKASILCSTTITLDSAIIHNLLYKANRIRKDGGDVSVAIVPLV